MATIESATETRAFHVEVPEEDLAELRRRIAATRWPERETVTAAAAVERAPAGMKG